MKDRFISTKEEYMMSLSVLLNSLGLPSDRVHALSTANFQAQGLGELYDIVAYSSYISSREMFPVTAQFKDSLFKWNKVADVSFQLASPSIRNFVLSMELEDVLKNSVMINPKIYRYTIPHTVEVKINEFIYSLDYDITIQVYDPEGQRAVTARYDVDTLYNPISKIKNPNIRVIKQGSRILLRLQLSQYERLTKTYRYIDKSTDVHAVSYTDQLVDFTPYYRETEFSPTVTRLLKSMYYDRSIPDKATIYYTLNSGKITLTNRGYRGSFYPEKDSSIELSIYVTKGKLGNFEYIGNNVILEDKEGEELPFYILAETDKDISAQGLDEDNLEQLRRKIVDSLHTRDSLITDYDLSKHFSSRRKNYKVIKSRDDWKMRVYSIYAPLYADDKQERIIPTNTLDVKLNLGDLINKDGYYKIKEKAHIRAKKNGGAEVRESAASDDKFDYMQTLIHMINRPKRVVETYEMYINRSQFLDFEYYYDKHPYSFMINQVRIQREPTKNIKIFFNMMTNLAGEGDLKTFHTLGSSGEIIDKGELEVHLSFETTKGNFAGYVKAQMVKYIKDNDMYEYMAELETDYFIKDSMFEVEMTDSSGTNNKNIPIKLESLKILVHDIANNTEKSSAEFGLPTPSTKGLINVFSAPSFEIVKEYTDLSHIQIKDIDSTNLILLNIPLFGYKYIERNGYLIFDSVYQEMDYINTLWLQTQTNFVSTLKFINTYGASINHQIGNDIDRLDKVNISFKFRVGLKYNASIDMNYIKDYIIKFFHNIDFINDESFHVSDLIQAVRNDISDVVKFEFDGINEYEDDFQLIIANYDPDDPNVIPEIVNIQYDDNGEYDVTLIKI